MTSFHHFALFLCLILTSASAIAQDSDVPKDPSPGINSGLVSSLSFRNIGPALMSGRILDIAVDPVKRSTWYIATVGGVWKTENAGVTWQPIFDGHGSYSIGCVAIDPNDRFTVWVGTGENNSQRSVGYGDGLYKSTNGGKSFQKVGLENSEHIGRILIHPNNGDIVYVAAQGPLWKEGGDRGLYQTTDGGKTWTKILDISENTGVNEVLMDPQDPQVLYATAYQRRRHTWVLINGGPESGIHKSTDGGKTWRKINRGLPGGDKGRIGMAISPINPEVVYALVEAKDGSSGFFRSANRGERWQKMSGYVSSSPQYYQEIVACPHKFDRVYSFDTFMQVSEDGGTTFTGLGEADKHVDNHALVIDPDDADHLLVGCDGGVYESWDRGKTYDFKANLPITQFYKVAVSNEKPFYYVYGGTQDNATQGGPSQTANVHGIRNSDWFITVFGDGFDPAVDPNDPDTIYSQWQYGGLVRFNRKTGERVDIRPQPPAGGPPNRWNWDSALMISPHASERIYYGSQILWRSDDRGDNWTAVSEDLSRNIDRNKLKVMGRVWGVDAVAKNDSTSLYGTIVSVSESPLAEGLIYAGTDDGLLSVTEDGGESWRKIEAFGSLEVPEFGYLNDIEADLHDPDTVYVAVNNHKRGDFKPYIVKSTDRGQSWTEISNNLPERGSVYCLKQDHENPELMFCGTEFGCFFTIDGGAKWVQLKSGIPTICVRDIEIQQNEDDLVLASFGRGFYILDDYSPLRELSSEFKDENRILPIRTGLMYPLAAPLAGSGRAFQGANFFIAPNPPFGVSISYHRKESRKSAKAEREAADAKAAAAGRDVNYPDWETLKAEDREVPAQTWLTIRDSEGNVVRRLRGSNAKGLHRVQWDYRHAGARRGPWAVPGKYTVDLVEMVPARFSGDDQTDVEPKQVDESDTESASKNNDSQDDTDADSQMQDSSNGNAPQMEIVQLVEPVEFEIVPLNHGQTSEPDRQAIRDYAEKALDLSKVITAASRVIGETRQQLSAIESVVRESVELEPEMLNEVLVLQRKLQDISEKFNGDPTKTRRNESAYPGFNSRLGTLVMGALGSTEGPTGTHMQQYDIVLDEFESVRGELEELINEEIPDLNRQLDDADAPWTPGRKIPKIK